MTSYVLGLSAFYHDSAVTLLKDGLPIAAAQEERFSRKRHDSGFPSQAIRYCLEREGIRLNDLEAIVYYEDPKIKFSRVLSSFTNASLKSTSVFLKILPEWLGWKLNVLKHLDELFSALDLGTAPKVVNTQHHRAHAASAFFPSPFENAAVICIDGIGEKHSTTIWHGRNNELKLVNSISYPHSIGLLYSAFTYYCGFKVDSGEYKLMGLAPYGEPIYAETIRENLVNIRSDGSYTLNMKYFEYQNGERMVGEAFEKLFNHPIRKPESPLTQRECDLAASVQKITEEMVLGIAKYAANITGEKNLCMAGGVALNCVANGVLSRSKIFDRLWIQPAAGDAGCSLGAAMDYAVKEHGRPHLRLDLADAMNGGLLGPEWSNEYIANYLQKNGYSSHYCPENSLYDYVAECLNKGAVVGWFQDRMEFGPRALGARSILGDPRNIEMQRTMNLKIKYRESFRPFAPAVLEEDAKKYFSLRENNPYMLIVSEINDEIKNPALKGEKQHLGSINEVRSELPSITHVDYSARVQTVSEKSNIHFTKLLRSFKKLTGCSVLVNTSFNVRGEPIVCKPEEAYACFMRTEMDVLVLGNYVLLRQEQPEFYEETNWRQAIPLD